MSITGKVGYDEEIGGARRSLLLRNGEIERFEDQYAPFGFFELLDRLVGRGAPAEVRHCRDVVALGLVGGGMSNRAADDLISSLPPTDNIHLRNVAQRLVVRTFTPPVSPGLDKKKDGAGSRSKNPGTPAAMMPDPGSPISAA